MSKSLCIFSYPRQGTDFFMSCMGCVHKDNNRTKCYYREYFNSIVNPRYKILFKKIHGNELNYESIFFNDFDKDCFNEIIKKSWLKDNLKITKENFSFIKIPYFVTYFNSLILYRHRKYTFPTSRPDFIENIYTKVCMSVCQDIF